MFRQCVLAGVLGLSAGLAHAEFSYNYIEGGIGEIGSDANSIYISGAKQSNRNLYLLGSAYYVDSDNSFLNYSFDGYYLEGGLGYTMPLTPQSDFFTNAQVLYANLDVPGDDDDIGGIVRAGMHYIPMDKLELEGAVAYSDNNLLKDDGVGATASARYYFAPRFSAALGYSAHTELDGVFLNVRYNLQ
jgi:hypothetical protein